MRECVIAENVPRINDPLNESGVGDSFAHEKERGREVVLGEAIEHRRRVFGMRSIVEREEHIV